MQICLHLHIAHTLSRSGNPSLPDNLIAVLYIGWYQSFSPSRTMCMGVAKLMSCGMGPFFCFLFIYIYTQSLLFSDFRWLKCVYGSLFAVWFLRAKIQYDNNKVTVFKQV